MCNAQRWCKQLNMSKNFKKNCGLESRPQLNYAAANLSGKSIDTIVSVIMVI